MTAIEANKQLYRRLVEEAFNGNDLDLVDEIVADDCVLHEAGRPEPIRGPEGVTEFLGTYRSAFPDAHLEIEELVAEGDLVAGRWTGTGTHEGELQGIEPTGAEVTVMGMEMWRVADGELVEGWEVFDSLGMLQQLGAVPESEPSPTA